MSRERDPAPEADAGLTVGRTAELVGVSVRTLHHWDEIALVQPSERTWAGYRLYSGADIARLQQVLVYREIGMPLAQIAEVLDDPTADVADHLGRQRELLISRIARLQELVSAVNRMMEAKEMNEELTPEEQARSFGSEWHDPYHEEAKDRYGHTEEWARSQERAKQLSPAEWDQAKRDLEALEAALAEAKRGGVQPGTEAANRLAEQHRAAIGRWFEVSRSKQVLMARNYVDDPRFTAHYDDREAGLATWLKAIIDANAEAHGVDPARAEWE
ncbi:MerR family transcriptional regulator [Brevibacterium daeguense]|nr:MerR family transcriptional regulator [Brevibacterium daeguense]